MQGINDAQNSHPIQSPLRPGDQVVMTDRYYEAEKYSGQVWTVVSGPWLVCGTEVVLLKGYRGGYAADGLRKLNS